MHRYPTYPRTPHSSGAARVKFKGKVHYLGAFGSPESHARLAELLTLWQAGGDDPPALRAHPGQRLTVAELVGLWNAFLKAEHGTDRRENANYRGVLSALVRLFGPTPAASFDCRSLDRLRDALISGEWLNDDERAWREKRKRPVGWSRGVVSRNVVRVRTLYRWAEEQGHVPRGAADHLSKLRPIPARSPRVRTLPARQAVEWDHAAQVLPHVRPVVAAMLELQHVTGLRTTEVCRIRCADVDRGEAGADIWLLKIGQHKNDWRPGQECDYLPLGPEAQRIIAPWLEVGGEYLFPPAYGRAHYDRNTYARAVQRGCDLGQLKRFSPYQLRHLAKRTITRAYGLDAARAVLRQKSLGATNGYARQIDLDTASEVARKIG